MTVPRAAHPLHPVRLATRLSTAVPPLRGVADRWLERRFRPLAEDWDVIRRDDAWTTDALAAAVQAIRGHDPGFAPARVLDVGTGTGQAAFALAEHLPEAEIVGVDLVDAMVERARAKALARGVEHRVAFHVGTGHGLPVDTGAFHLAVSVLVQPFGDELGRVLAPGGWAAFVYGARPESPIRFGDEQLRRVLAPRGFDPIETFPEGRADVTIARAPDR